VRGGGTAETADNQERSRMNRPGQPAIPPGDVLSAVLEQLHHAQAESTGTLRVG